jgi:hypothetical protein
MTNQNYSTYNGIRGYFNSLVGAALVGSAVLFGGLEARAQDWTATGNRNAAIEKDKTLTKQQKSLMISANFHETLIGVGDANQAVADAEKMKKTLEEIKANQEKILAGANGTNYVNGTTIRYDSPREMSDEEFKDILRKVKAKKDNKKDDVMDPKAVAYGTYIYNPTNKTSAQGRSTIDPKAVAYGNYIYNPTNKVSNKSADK